MHTGSRTMTTCAGPQIISNATRTTTARSEMDSQTARIVSALFDIIVAELPDDIR
jgi:hypothetical protein